MAEPEKMLAEANERELYDSVHKAATNAEIEGDAQLQAAVDAAHAPLAADSDELVRLNRWSLCFDNGKLESAYIRTMNTNCKATASCHDYIPAVVKLALGVPNFFWVFITGQRSQSDGVVERNWSKAIQLWHLVVALVCCTFMAVQFGASKWYRSNRGNTLFWSVGALWLIESINILLISHVNVSRFLIGLVAPCIYMSFVQVVPFRLHLQYRLLGIGGQFGAILVGENRAQAYKMVLGLALGHLLGVGLAYYLDRRARLIFLRSLPRWLLEEVTGVGIQSPSFLSYRASLTRQLWSIFYPGLLEPEPRKNGATSLPRTPFGPHPPEFPTRRALGGFAGGFGGVSGLRATTTTTYNPIPLSSPSTSSSDHDGDVDSSSSDEEWGPEVTQVTPCHFQQNWLGGQHLGHRAQTFPRYKHQGRSSAGSEVHSGSSSWQQSRTYGRAQPDTDDGW